jgi:hypothetical protein
MSDDGLMVRVPYSGTQGGGNGLMVRVRYSGIEGCEDRSAMSPPADEEEVDDHAMRQIQGIWEHLMHTQMGSSGNGGGDSGVHSTSSSPQPATTHHAPPESSSNVLPTQIVMGTGGSPDEEDSYHGTVGLIVYLYSRANGHAGSHAHGDDAAVLSCPWTIHTLEYDLVQDAALNVEGGSLRAYDMRGDQVINALTNWDLLCLDAFF